MTPAPRPDWTLGTLLGAFLLIGAALYLPASGAPPLLDEGDRVHLLAEGTPAWALAFQEHPDESEPLANLVRHTLVRAGGAASWIRVAAVILHGLTAGVVFLLCRAQLRRDQAGAPSPSLVAPTAAAVVLLVHPLVSESLLSYGGFSLVLATFFVFLSVLMAALDAAGDRPKRSFAAAAFYLAALLCDVSVWPVGLVVAGLARGGGGDAARRGWASYARSLWPYATGLALVYLSWTVRLWPSLSFLEVRRAWGVLSGIASQSAAFVTELKLLVVPTGLSVHHGDFAYVGSWGLQSIAGAAMLALLLAAGALLGRRTTLGGLAVGVLAALHVHVLLFPPAEPIQERRLYAVVAAASMACAAGLLFLEKRAGARATFVVAAILSVALSIFAKEQVRLWDDPIALWEEAVVASPRSPVPHVVMGNIHLSNGEPDRSLQSFESALARAPRNAAIQQSIAEVYARKGDFERAAQEAGKALEFDPNSFSAYLTAGNAYMMRDRPREAFLMFNEALRRRPNDVSAIFNMGSLFYEQRRYGKAAALLDQAAQARPHDPEILFRLGMSRLNSGDLAGAAEALRGCIAEAPDRADARVNLGTILTQLGHHEEARLMLQSVLDVDADNAVVLNGLAVLASAQDRWEEARDLFERAAARDPNDHRILYNLAGAYERLGERQKAAQTYHAFLERWSGSLEVGESARARLAVLEAGAPR